MRARSLLVALLFVAAAAGCAADTAVAVPAAEPIAPALVEFGEPLTGPIRMVELRDGRLLLMDTRERRLLRVDLASGTFDTISRQGDGPLEYRSIFVLAPAPSDSIWGFDISRRRMIVFDPQGNPIRAFSTMIGDEPMQRVTAPWMRSVDSAGRWLGRGRRFIFARPRMIISDTNFVLRTTPESNRVDTVAVLKYTKPERNADGSSVITDFTDVDAWAAFSDGAVLVVRGADYRVELHRPDGTMDSAGVIPHRRVTLTEREAELVRDSVAKQLGALVAATMANIPGLREGPRPPTHVLPDPLPTHWPLLVDDDLIAVDRQDRAWVRVRTASFDTGATRFDLIGRDGRFIKAVQIPAGEQLVGFGRETAYLARRDADGLLWLKKHPLP